MTSIPVDPEARLSVEGALLSIFRVEDYEGALRITTHCMYPSNGFVRVMVRGGAHSMVAADDGEALGEALAAGIDIPHADKFLGPFVRARGLILKDGVIMTKAFPTEAAAVAIAHVANTAKEAAYWLYEHGGAKRKRDFRTMLANFLTENFKNHVSEEKLLGASHKLHTFANVISFANGRKIIVDTASNDSSSINARVVANIDVKAMSDPSIEQRIVYDDNEGWSSSNLSLLQMAATVVPFSRSIDVIKRLADETRRVA